MENLYGKSSDPTGEPRPDSWTLAQGQRDGFPMMIRIANAYKDLAPLPGYDHHIILSVNYQNPQPNGFPPSEVGDALQLLEENLSRILEPGNDSICALVITNNGLRDFIYYTRSVDAAKRELDRNVAIFKGFRIELAIEPARDWEIYRVFMAQVHRAN